MSESNLISAIIKRLWVERQWISIDRANSGSRPVEDKSGRKSYIKLHKAGTPDLVGFFAPHGQYIGFEVKLPDKKQQESQVAFQKDVESKGGIYWLAYSLDDIEQFIKEYKPCKN